MKNRPLSPEKLKPFPVQGIWSGTISFSLVAIPVQLVKAVEPGRVSFRTLHSKDYSPLARKMFCPADETMVRPEEVIRGYEIGPDKYILVTDIKKDFAALLRQTSSISQEIVRVDFPEGIASMYVPTGRVKVAGVFSVRA